MSCPPPPTLCFRYAAMPLSADTSRTATPFQPTFATSVWKLSLALHIRLHRPPVGSRSSRVLCRWVGFAVARRHGYESHRVPPSFHPLIAATASIALVSPRRVSPPVSPSSPHIPIALATPGRYHNPTTYDIQRHTICTWVPPSTPVRSRRWGFRQPRSLPIRSFADTRRRRQ
jgi:hypothetical protein